MANGKKPSPDASRRGNDRRDGATQPDPNATNPADDPIKAARIPKPATNMTQHLKGTGYSGDEAVVEDMPPPPRTTPDGLRLDGPPFSKWVDDGNDPADYPPPSYADLRIVDVESGLRIDGPTYEDWLARGNKGADYPPPGFKDRRGESDDRVDDEGFLLDTEGHRIIPGVLGTRPQGTTSVEASRGAVDPPAGGVARRPPEEPIRRVVSPLGVTAAAMAPVPTPPTSMPAQSWVSKATAASMPLIDATTGLRTNGPTYDEYVAAGYDGVNYPPAGYTDKRLPAGQWPANVPADQRTPPPPAASVLSSDADKARSTGEAIDYGSTQGQEQTHAADGEQR